MQTFLVPSHDSRSGDQALPPPDHCLAPFSGTPAPDGPPDHGTRPHDQRATSALMIRSRRVVRSLPRPPSAGSTWDAGRRAGRRSPRQTCQCGNSGAYGHHSGVASTAVAPVAVSQSIALPSGGDVRSDAAGLRGCNARLAVGAPRREWAYCTTIVTRLCAPHKVGLLTCKRWPSRCPPLMRSSPVRHWLACGGSAPAAGIAGLPRCGWRRASPTWTGPRRKAWSSCPGSRRPRSATIAWTWPCAGARFTGWPPSRRSLVSGGSPP